MNSQLPDWTPFVRDHVSPLNLVEMDARAQQLAGQLGMDHSIALKQLRRIQHDGEIWTNSRYQVNIDRDPGNGTGPVLVHLSIKRRDKQPVGPERYRDFMCIKDELVGPECEGIELYPARSRELDGANQYHMWVFDRPEFRIPWGFGLGELMGSRAVMDGSGMEEPGGSIQQPMEAHHVR